VRPEHRKYVKSSFFKLYPFATRIRWQANVSPLLLFTKYRPMRLINIRMNDVDLVPPANSFKSRLEQKTCHGTHLSFSSRMTKILLSLRFHLLTPSLKQKVTKKFRKEKSFSPGLDAPTFRATAHGTNAFLMARGRRVGEFSSPNKLSTKRSIV
jgi:hypothetical protein